MKYRIGIKLILAVAFTAIIIIGVYAYFNIVAQKEALFATVTQQTMLLAETVKSSMRYDMLMNHRDHLRRIVTTVGEQPCIRQVRIINKDGVIAYSALLEEIGKVLHKDEISCAGCHEQAVPLAEVPPEKRTWIFKMHPDSARVLAVINPIYNEPACSNSTCHAHDPNQKVLGMLDITVCLTTVDRQIGESATKVAIFAGLSILAIGLIIGIFVYRWVDSPVGDLVDATRQVASGNFSYRIEKIGRDELGELKNSFNIMTEKLAVARLKLLQSDKMASLGKLAAGVAHEINNPLTGILTYSSVLLKESQDNLRVKGDIEIIVREAQRAREIVKNLLDFARQSVPKKKNADLAQIVQRSLDVFTDKISRHKVRIETQIIQNLPLIAIDEQQIQQVIVNLIDNSLDACNENDNKIRIGIEKVQVPPYGHMQIKDATCPKNHSLLSSDYKIDGLCTIKLIFEINVKKGIVFIDPVYGKNRHNYNPRLENGVLIDLKCPECNISLVQPSKECRECGAAAYKFIVPGNGYIERCSRVGCPWVRWANIEERGEQKWIQITVDDNGCGIPEDNLNKIFDPFFSTKQEGGTGLGLAVVWGIIENHNGSINIHSEVGKGTKVTLRLPLI